MEGEEGDERRGISLVEMGVWCTTVRGLEVEGEGEEGKGRRGRWKGRRWKGRREGEEGEVEGVEGG